MRAIENRRYEMLQRVRQFGVSHRELFPEASAGRQAFTAVDVALDRLSSHFRLRLSSAGEGRRAKAHVRRELVGRLAALTRTARVIARSVPECGDRFQFPVRVADRTVLITGRVFVRDAKAFEDQFIAHGMPATFLADLAALVERFETSLRARDAGVAGHAAARAGMAAAFASALAAVQTLDVVVANQLQGNGVALAVWKRDRAVGYPRRVRKAA